MLDCLASAGTASVHLFPPLPLDDLAEVVTLADHRRVLLRAIRPEDEAAHIVFSSRLTREDVYFRFFSRVSPAAIPTMMFRFTHIDYRQEMAIIAVPADDAVPETLGVVRAVMDPDTGCAEFAVTVRSDLKGLGLGETLMRKMIGYAKGAGAVRLFGTILADNRRMLRLVRKLGFTVERAGGDLMEAHVDLQDGSREAAIAMALAYEWQRG